MARDGYYMAEAKGVDLTAWDNAQVALLVGELNAVDWFIGASVTHTKPKTKNVNPMTAGHYPRRINEGRILGKIATTHRLQTGIFTYDVLGACTTTGGPTYTHTISKATVETPISTAFHFEKEGTTANRRKDCMGMVPIGIDISCSEQDPTARQVYTSEFAFTGAGGDLAQPSPLVQSVHTPYNWYHYRDVSGASEFKFNSGAINVSIIGFNMHIGWIDRLFGDYDLAGYPTNGLVVPPLDAYIDVDVRISDAGGTDINTIADTALVNGVYAAGDLDMIIDFYESATRDLKYTWDKMYIVPDSYEEVFQEEGSWFDGATFRLALANQTSSVGCIGIDAISKTSYEND